jgi:hypothetical protein
MTTPSPTPLRLVGLNDLTIEDERSFRHVGLYAELAAVLRRSEYRFRVLPEGSNATWDRAVFLNLTFWGASGGGDVLVDATIPADVVTHVAWHHLATAALVPRGTEPSAEALFLGESIASAFDLYLVGRLLGHSPEASFLETQVPAMADCAEAAGVSAEAFDALLATVADAPERAFEGLRNLLFDATCTLFRATSLEAAHAALVKFDDHPLGCLLHRHELSNWVLYAKAYASRTNEPDAHAIALDRALAAAPVSLDWLTTHWIDGKGEPVGWSSLRKRAAEP